MSERIDLALVSALPKVVMEDFYQKRFLDKGHADCGSYRAEWEQRFAEGFAWRLMDSQSRRIFYQVLIDNHFGQTAEILRELD
jgi:hypothetical protein